jgi:ABC-type phosphate transport system substrate-binding protein
MDVPARARRFGLLAVATITLTTAVSGLSAGGAQAASCAGVNIQGQGSSLQGAAQTIWTLGLAGTKGFNTNTAGGGCALSGGRPTARYTSSGSGACLDGFGANGGVLDTTYAFCGTEQAPSEAQITVITATANGSRALSIAVAQSAIAVVVNPPAGCSLTAVVPGQLEGAFRGTTANWTTLGGTGGGCDAKINRVVRADNAGTTYQFKRYLGMVNGAAVLGPSTWTDLQGRVTPANNLTWPHPTTGTSPLIYSTAGCATVMALPCSGAGSGDGDEVRTVGATPGSIGYAGLPDARAVTAANGATWPNLKWLNVRSGAVTLNPSTNGLSSTKAQANCPTASGAYGTLPSPTGDWSQVYLTTPGSTYPICTLTWDLAFNDYTLAGYPSATVAFTAKDYLHYVVTTGGGQSDALGGANDYATLPSDVRTTATAGVALINAPAAGDWHTAKNGNYTANDADGLRFRLHATPVVDFTCGNPTLTGTVNASPPAGTNPWPTFATGTIAVAGGCTVGGVGGYGVTCASTSIATESGPAAYFVGGVPPPLANADGGKTSIVMSISCQLQNGGANCTTVVGTVKGNYTNPVGANGTPGFVFLSPSPTVQSLTNGASTCGALPASSTVTMTDANGLGLLFVLSNPAMAAAQPYLWWG